MAETSDDILSRFQQRLGKEINLVLSPAYLGLLARLGNPQDHLPPVFHVAGTNGKGSTCAFLRACIESNGQRAHVYTSPHLVRFHERIRLAGDLIDETRLVAALHEVEAAAEPGTISLFEASTAAAFLCFARVPADYIILETGLGGRLDATNVVKKPLATLITRLSFDHRDYLGDRIEQIAAEKAGIMRPGVPCFAAPQPNEGALAALRQAATDIGAPLSVGGIDWRVDIGKEGFTFADRSRRIDLPHPALAGAHQYWNAGLAVAALSALPSPPSSDALRAAMQNVSWPARLQRLAAGDGNSPEIWLDGGHNDSAGEVLAQQIARWRAQDGDAPKTLYIIMGMLTTKTPEEFLSPFATSITALRTVPIAHSAAGFAPAELARRATALGIADVKETESPQQALAEFRARGGQARILICGSLYLAGEVLEHFPIGSGAERP